MLVHAVGASRPATASRTGMRIKIRTRRPAGVSHQGETARSSPAQKSRPASCKACANRRWVPRIVDRDPAQLLGAERPGASACTTRKCRSRSATPATRFCTSRAVSSMPTRRSPRSTATTTSAVSLSTLRSRRTLALAIHARSDATPGQLAASSRDPPTSRTTVVSQTTWHFDADESSGFGVSRHLRLSHEDRAASWASANVCAQDKDHEKGNKTKQPDSNGKHTGERPAALIAEIEREAPRKDEDARADKQRRSCSRGVCWMG